VARSGSTTGSSGSPRLLRVLRGDDRDRFAEVAHAVDGEHRLIGKLEAVGLGAGDVGVGENGVHARHRDCLRAVDLENERVRVRAP
jgi:hypothetical protein